MADTKLNIKEFLDKDEQKDLLRFLTAGSVDDGKSTLIGRLLFDSKKIYEDQLDALERDSKRMGNAGEHIDYALLLDGLKAEREQGITIDVAYRYFSTNNRKFIIADTPGHEQYTRNMITGGSTANLAIILVDRGRASAGAHTQRNETGYHDRHQRAVPRAAQRTLRLRQCLRGNQPLLPDRQGYPDLHQKI